MGKTVGAALRNVDDVENFVLANKTHTARSTEMVSEPNVVLVKNVESHFDLNYYIEGTKITDSGVSRQLDFEDEFVKRTEEEIDAQVKRF